MFNSFLCNAYIDRSIDQIYDFLPCPLLADSRLNNATVNAAPVSNESSYASLRKIKIIPCEADVLQ